MLAPGLHSPHEVESKGIRLVPHGHDAYPQRLRTRLGDAAPPLLYAAGPIEWLNTELIGVVGSRNVDNEGAAVAEGVAAVATRIGAGIVSGGAKGVDLKSMDAAYQAGVPSVGITAEGIGESGTAQRTAQRSRRGTASPSFTVRSGSRFFGRERNGPQQDRVRAR